MNAYQNMPEDSGTPAGTTQDIPERSPFADKELLTVEEAVVHFRELGLPRSREAIRGYCRQGKIEATTIQGAKGEQHMLSRESADSYITERKRILASMSRDMPEGAGTSRKLTVVSETYRNEPEDAGNVREAVPDPAILKEKDAEIATLREEVISLKIDKAARDHVVSMLREERAQLAETAMEQSRKVGELETRLQLAAPTGGNDAPTSPSQPIPPPVTYRPAGDSIDADPAPGAVY